MSDKVKLAYLVSHPIQYQTPLLRRIALEQDIDLTVFFGSDFSVRGYRDKGFGVAVKWDVPLLDGYKHEFLPVIRDDARTGIMRPLNYGIFSRLRGGGLRTGGDTAFDVLWVHGYSTVNALHAMFAAKALGIPVLLRAESWLREEEKRFRAVDEAIVLSYPEASGQWRFADRDAKRSVLAALCWCGFSAVLDAVCSR